MWMLINQTIFAEDTTNPIVMADALISLVNASIDVSKKSSCRLR